MHSQVILGKIASTAAHLVDLLQGFRGFRRPAHAVDAGADSAPVRFGTNGPHFYPVILRRRIAPNELRVVVDGVYRNVDISIIVEVAKGAPSRRCRRAYSSSSF